MSCPDALGLTAAVNTLAVLLAERLTEEELEMAAALLTQLGDTLAVIAVRRGICGRQAQT